MHAYLALRDIYRYRALLLHLAGVQFRTRYQNALLGVGWSMATPLCLFVVFVTIFKPVFGVKRPHYGLWLLSALFPWTFLSASVGETIRSLQANATFIQANRFPREVLPLAGVLVQLVNLTLSLIIVVGYAALSTNGLSWALLWLPLVVAILTLFTAGLCLLLSSLDAIYKDVRYFVDVGMLAWFFLTPIFWDDATRQEKLTETALGAERWVWLLAELNPLTPMVEAVRGSLELQDCQIPSLWIPGLVALLTFVFGLSQFRRLVNKYVDLL